MVRDKISTIPFVHISFPSPLSVFFIGPMYKLLLNKPVTVSDLESVDADFHRSIKWMLYAFFFSFNDSFDSL